MFAELMLAWKQVYATFLDRKIGRVMYYYLVFCLVVIAGLYVYLLWMGAVGFSIMFSVWSGSRLVTDEPAINIVRAIGMILIIRYTLLSGIDAVAKRTPEKMEERLTLIEDKLRDMHTLAFTGFLNSGRVREVKALMRQEKLARKPKAEVKKAVK